MRRLRTCSRCGDQFLTEHAALICPACRKPASQELTFREKQLIRMLTEDAPSNKELAGRLCLTEGTIKEYMNRIFHKTNSASRGELILWAFKHPERIGLPKDLKAHPTGPMLDIEPG